MKNQHYEEIFSGALYYIRLNNGRLQVILLLIQEEEPVKGRLDIQIDLQE